jgi:hypothetical protein
MGLADALEMLSDGEAELRAAMAPVAGVAMMEGSLMDGTNAGEIDTEGLKAGLWLGGM